MPTRHGIYCPNAAGFRSASCDGPTVCIDCITAEEMHHDNDPMNQDQPKIFPVYITTGDSYDERLYCDRCGDPIEHDLTGEGKQAMIERYGQCADCREIMEGDGNLYQRSDGLTACQYCL